LQTNELLGRLANDLPGFGINVILNYDHVPILVVDLIIVHDKIIVLLGTWSLT
jgi:hypothetical protein